MSLDLEALRIMDLKERMLNEIIVWLKSRDLWDECKKDLVTYCDGLEPKP